MITSTINTTSFDAVVIERETLNIQRFFEERYGTLNEEGIGKQMEKKWTNNFTAYVKAENIRHNEAKFGMDESLFIELAKELSDEDSKLGLITRTLKVYKVKYEAITKEREFVKDACFVKKLAGNQLEKAVNQDAKEKGYATVFQIGQPYPIETLYGMDKSEFVKKGVMM